MPEKDPFLLLRSNLKRHTAEKPTRVVDPPSALRFCAALAVCAASPLTTTHGQGPVQLGKGTGCALVWPRPSAGSSRIACSNGHMSRPQRPTAHAPAAAAAAALGHIYLSAQGGWVGSVEDGPQRPSRTRWRVPVCRVAPGGTMGSAGNKGEPGRLCGWETGAPSPRSRVIPGGAI